MRTKFLLQAKKFFIETFGNDKFPEKEEMYRKMISSAWVPRNSKIIFSIFYTKEILEEYHSKFLVKYNLSIPQLEIIKILYFSKSKELSQEDIGKFTFASKANVSSHLAKLEGKSLIKRKENPSNKRKKIVYLTKNGEDLLFEVAEKFNPYEMNKLLDKNETKEFLRMIEKIQNNVGEVRVENE